jgi:hypothetical protein
METVTDLAGLVQLVDGEAVVLGEGGEDIVVVAMELMMSIMAIMAGGVIMVGEAGIEEVEGEGMTKKAL